MHHIDACRRGVGARTLTSTMSSATSSSFSRSAARWRVNAAASMLSSAAPPPPGPPPLLPETPLRLSTELQLLLLVVDAVGDPAQWGMAMDSGPWRGNTKTRGTKVATSEDLHAMVCRNVLRCRWSGRHSSACAVAVLWSVSDQLPALVLSESCFAAPAPDVSFVSARATVAHPAEARGCPGGLRVWSGHSGSSARS